MGSGGGSCGVISLLSVFLCIWRGVDDDVKNLGFLTCMFLFFFCSHGFFVWG